MFHSWSGEKGLDVSVSGLVFLLTPPSETKLVWSSPNLYITDGN